MLGRVHISDRLDHFGNDKIIGAGWRKHHDSRLAPRRPMIINSAATAAIYIITMIILLWLLMNGRLHSIL